VERSKKQLLRIAVQPRVTDSKLRAVVVVELVTMEKKPGQKAQQTCERCRQSNKSDWSKYYQEK